MGNGRINFRRTAGLPAGMAEAARMPARTPAVRWCFRRAATFWSAQI